MAAPETNWLPGILVTAAGIAGSLAYLSVSYTHLTLPTSDLV